VVFNHARPICNLHSMQVVIDPKSPHLWEENPDLDKVVAFRRFKEEYGEERSARILRSLYYIYDPRSPLLDSSKTFEEIVSDINETVLNEPDFDWEPMQYLVKEYFKHATSRAVSELARFQNEIIKLNDLLDEWEWDKKDAKAKIDLMLASEKAMAGYIKLREQVKDEQVSSESFAGYSKSLLENAAGSRGGV
jgi:hypothetical protein